MIDVGHTFVTIIITSKHRSAFAASHRRDARLCTSQLRSLVCAIGIEDAVAVIKKEITEKDMIMVSVGFEPTRRNRHQETEHGS